MLMLFLACACVAAWAICSLQAEIGQRRPQEPANSPKTRFELEDIVWSDGGTQSLRRRSLTARAFAACSLLCLARLIWDREVNPDHRLIGVVIAILLALVVTGGAVKKIIRFGL